MAGQTDSSREKQMDPSTVFTRSVMDQIQKGDVSSMVEAQREMLTRFEKTNEMLLNFNMLSTGRYETTMLEFKQHTNLLYDMKKDLDAIFRRIRVLKERLSSSHPQAFKACGDVYFVPDDTVEKKDKTESTGDEENHTPQTEQISQEEEAENIQETSTKSEEFSEQSKIP